MQQRLSAEVIKRLMKKYRPKMGTTVGDIKRFEKMLAGGTSIPKFMAKRGGHVRKKAKKK